MKVYLDTSALNRVFDDQSQARIYLESTSMQLIFLLIENEILEIISSDALVFKTERNPLFGTMTVGDIYQEIKKSASLAIE